MRRGPLLVLSAACVTGLALVAAACTTDYQKGLDDPLYGDPNALAGKKQPGASTDYAVGGEGGVSSGGASIVCVTTGGTIVDGGACSVSFSKDVLPIFGNSTCTDPTCHGGASPPNPPRIEPGDPLGTWQEFAGFKMNAGTPYIDPCSTDKAESGIACNLLETGACGVKMPQGGSPQTSQEDITKIETWLACGSPNN